MTTEELKEYTNEAKKLEIAIYTQKKLMEKHKVILKGKQPIKPIKKKIDEPITPNIDYARIRKDKNNGLIAIISLCTMGVLGIPLIFTGAIFFGILCLLAGALGIFGIHTQREEKEYNDNKIKNEYDAYYKYREEYPKLVKKAEEEYKFAINKYNSDANEYELNFNSTMHQHEEALKSLENALSKLYEDNIIFSKYRNLVAITAINEYLESGRCFELEGPNGAYNLYEMELRQNIIIGQLSNIISNLEQIKNNQYTLYEELTKANNTVEQIVYELKELNETSKLTAHFAQVAAIAASAPKVYRTYTF